MLFFFWSFFFLKKTHLLCNKFLKLCARKNRGNQSLMKVFHIESSIRKTFRTHLERIIKWQVAWHVIIIDRYSNEKLVKLYKSLQTIMHNSLVKKWHDKRSRSICKTIVYWLKKRHVFFLESKAKTRNSIEIVLNMRPGIGGVIASWWTFASSIYFGLWHCLGLPAVLEGC